MRFSFESLWTWMKYYSNKINTFGQLTLHSFLDINFRDAVHIATHDVQLFTRLNYVMGLIWVWWNAVGHVMHAKSTHVVIHKESTPIEETTILVLFIFATSFLYFPYFHDIAKTISTEVSFSLNRSVFERDSSTCVCLFWEKQNSVRKMNELLTQKLKNSRLTN